MRAPWFSLVLCPGGEKTARQSVHWRACDFADPTQVSSCKKDKCAWDVCVFADLGVCDPLLFNFEYVDVESGAQTAAVEDSWRALDGAAGGPRFTPPEGCV